MYGCMGSIITTRMRDNKSGFQRLARSPQQQGAGHGLKAVRQCQYNNPDCQVSVRMAKLSDAAACNMSSTPDMPILVMQPGF